MLAERKDGERTWLWGYTLGPSKSSGWATREEIRTLVTEAREEERRRLLAQAERLSVSAAGMAG